MADPLEGISEKSTKAQLWDKLTAVARQLQSAQREVEREQAKQAKEHATKLQQIEDRIRATRPKGETQQLQNVIVSCTVDELHELAEFFDDFKDVADHLPFALRRLVVGVDVLLGRDVEAENAAA